MPKSAKQLLMSSIGLYKLHKEVCGISMSCLNNRAAGETFRAKEATCYIASDISKLQNFQSDLFVPLLALSTLET